MRGSRRAWLATASRWGPSNSSWPDSAFVAGVSCYADAGLYRDPAFSRPDFRGAIGALRRQIGPGESVVLVSGHSRPADIEMTLAFGVHGPKALVVLILMD